jgi:site-specific DNA-methyltransferase (adenine-specific)
VPLVGQVYGTERATLIQGDCLEVMQSLPDASVDAVITDPPYGKTECVWDCLIDLPALWDELTRLLIPCGAVVMTAVQPFTSVLVSSNLEWFRYCWVWEKDNGANAQNAKHMPIMAHEDVVVFSEGRCGNGCRSPMIYHPQGLVDVVMRKTHNDGGKDWMRPGRKPVRREYTQTKTGYPRSILRFGGVSSHDRYHPTQKPVALMEYLLRTYTSEDDTVLDFCAGSGTTGVACLQTGRKFIGIEIDPAYCAVAKERIAKAELACAKEKET